MQEISTINHKYKLHCHNILSFHASSRSSVVSCTSIVVLFCCSYCPFSGLFYLASYNILLWLLYFCYFFFLEMRAYWEPPLYLQGREGVRTLSRPYLLDCIGYVVVIVMTYYKRDSRY